MKKVTLLGCAYLLATAQLSASATSYKSSGLKANPYDFEYNKTAEMLAAADSDTKASGLERLSFMRSFKSVKKVLPLLNNSDAEVRREAVMNLGWTGDAKALKPLYNALSDSDWTVRQAAAVSLFNLTALDVTFDALAKEGIREEQKKAFLPIFEKGYSDALLKQFKEVRETLPSADEYVYDLALGKPITVSSSAKVGRTQHINSGRVRGWDGWSANKKDKNPSVIVDLKKKYDFEIIRITQKRNVLMKNMTISVSNDGKKFTEIDSEEETEYRQISDTGGSARYIKVESTGSTSKKIPMFIGSLEVWSVEDKNNPTVPRETFYKAEKLARALRTYKHTTAIPEIIEALQLYKERVMPYGNDWNKLFSDETLAIENRAERFYMQALIRTLGQLGGPKAEAALIEIMTLNKEHAYYCAQALGDCGGEKAAAAIISLLQEYGVHPNRNPARRAGNYDAVPTMPVNDTPNLSAVDRVPRTYFAMMMALSRIDWSSKENVAALRAASPSLLSSVPNSWDATIVYKHEPYQILTGWLLEKAGVRRYAVDAVFEALEVDGHALPKKFELAKQYRKIAKYWLHTSGKRSAEAAYAGSILMSACDKSDIPSLIKLLDVPNGWIKIDAAKTLRFLDAKQAIAPTIKLLKKAKDDMDYGVDGDFDRFRALHHKKVNKIKTKKGGSGYDEINDPSPRHKEAWIRLLGGLKAEKAVPTLVKYLNNDRNATEIQYAAAKALYEIGSPKALAALRVAEQSHPVGVVKVLAREALWANKLEQLPRIANPKIEQVKQLPIPDGLPKEIVFIKGDLIPPNTEQFSQDMAAYSTTDGGPTYRLGRNIYRLKTDDPEGSLKPLTTFKDGWVSDLEVSYDGKHIIFARRGATGVDPFWHIYEMKADGSDLKQLTNGPYSDVHPNYMPDGRIVFTSTRSGIRDEYHGYPSNSLSVMNRDGSDIHIIGWNIGRDAEPVVGDDGKILFTRLELFYSRLKTEWNLLSVFPDGTKSTTLYGPERRMSFFNIKGSDAMSPPRHRVLRITQPQPWKGSEFLINSFRGPMITKGPENERILRKDTSYAVTTPYPLNETTLLVAAGKRPPKNKRHPSSYFDKKYDVMAHVDHGLHYMNTETGELTAIYNDPATAEFEARPLQPRKVPSLRPVVADTRSDAFTSKMYCNSVFNTRQSYVKERGKYIRVIEGIPTIARHQSHTNGGIAWRNHGGATGRVWATIPLAVDGSFAVEIPSDRLFHFQVLDADKRVMGNEFVWQSNRPTETKSCVGCHEPATSAPRSMKFPKAHAVPAIKCLPKANDVTYHAKAWTKGWLNDEREERMRTVNATDIFGRE